MRRFIGHFLLSNRDITSHCSSVNFDCGLAGDQLLTGIGVTIYC